MSSIWDRGIAITYPWLQVRTRLLNKKRLWYYGSLIFSTSGFHGRSEIPHYKISTNGEDVLYIDEDN
jgi:hypothetical protein